MDIVESTADISRIAAESAVAECTTGSRSSIGAIDTDATAISAGCVVCEIGPRNRGNYSSQKRYSGSVTGSVTCEVAVSNRKIGWTRIGRRM